MYQQLKRLAKARAIQQAAKEAKDAAQEKFWEQPENALIIDRYEAAKIDLEDAENRVRIDALTLFDTNNEKKHDGYQIKTITSVSITDSKAAFEWCLSNFTPALQLNNKVFKSAAKDGNIPGELTEVKEEPKVYVDKDLSRFLEE